MAPSKKNAPHLMDTLDPGNGNNLDREQSNSTTSREKKNGAIRWEYVLVTFHDYRGWRPRYINGHELNDWMNNPLIHEYIEKMAEDGWDLAAATGGVRMYGSADLHQIYFKRPREK